MLSEIQKEEDETLFGIVNIIAQNGFGMHGDPFMLQEMISYILERDFDYISLEIREHISKMSSLTLRDMSIMFNEHLLVYNVLHGMTTSSQWVRYIYDNIPNYKRHLMGIKPELIEIADI